MDTKMLLRRGNYVVFLCAWCLTPVIASAFNGVSRGWTINPFKAAKPFAGAASFVAPTFVRENIAILEEIFGIEDAQWTVFAKTVVLNNCAIGFKNQTEPALRIGRLAVHWDSLTTPTIDIEVEDVSVTVEFANLLMTRTNWNELIDGASPLVSSYEATSKWFQWDEETDEQEDFLNFNSINLLGNISMAIKSRPLKKDMGKMSLAMDVNDLTTEISAASERNFKLYGKRGCSTAELSTILRRYFTKQFKVLIQAVAEDPQDAISRANSLLSKAKAFALDYSYDTRTEALRKLGRLLTKRIEIAGEKLTVLLKALTQKIHHVGYTIRRRLGLTSRRGPTPLLKYNNHTETNSRKTGKANRRRSFLPFF